MKTRISQILKKATNSKRGNVRWRVFKVQHNCLCESIYRHDCMPEKKPDFIELKTGPFQFYVRIILLYISFHPLTTLLMPHLQRSMNRTSFNPLWSKCDAWLVWGHFFLCTYQFFSHFPQIIPSGAHNFLLYFTTLLGLSL